MVIKFNGVECEKWLRFQRSASERIFDSKRLNVRDNKSISLHVLSTMDLMEKLKDEKLPLTKLWNAEERKRDFNELCELMA